jgi:hypothetical protein
MIYSLASKVGMPFFQPFYVIYLTRIYILKKIRNYTKTKVHNGETLPKLNITGHLNFDLLG